MYAYYRKPQSLTENPSVILMSDKRLPLYAPLEPLPEFVPETKNNGKPKTIRQSIPNTDGTVTEYEVPNPEYQEWQTQQEPDMRQKEYDLYDLAKEYKMDIEDIVVWQGNLPFSGYPVVMEDESYIDYLRNATKQELIDAGIIPPDPTPEEQRKVVILARLVKLDELSSRAMRAIALNRATDMDLVKLGEYEDEAEALRIEYKKLEGE